jgi:hypothetical protein
MGLIELDTSFKATIVSLAQYIHSASDSNLQLVNRHHQQLSNQTSIIKLAQIFTGQPFEQRTAGLATREAKKARRAYVKGRHEETSERWGASRRAGAFAELLERDNIDKAGSLEWLKRGVLRFDGERIILGAQDQALYTNGLKKILGLTEDNTCRFCREAVESMNHLLSGCKVLLLEGRYTDRHNCVCRVIHWKLSKHYGFKVESNSWKHEPPPFLENESVKITYDRSIPVARHITNSALRPDIVVIDKRANKAWIIDVSVPNDYGIGRQEREKVVKYQDLKNDMKDTYRLNDVEVVPVILGATGVIKKNFREYLKVIPGDIGTLELQVEVVRATVSIIKRALGCRLFA